MLPAPLSRTLAGLETPFAPTQVVARDAAPVPRAVYFLRLGAAAALGIFCLGVGVRLSGAFGGDAALPPPWVERFTDLPALLNYLLWAFGFFWTARLMERTSASLRRRVRLERSVEERTHQLAAANTELESRMQELRAATEALRQSEERYALVLAASRDGIWDLDMVSGRQFYSPRLFEMLEFSPDAGGDRLKAWQARIHPEDLPRIRETARAHFKFNKPYRIECRVRMPDGSWRWTLNVGIGVRDARGWVVRMVGSTSDIDVHKRASEALAQAAERYHFLADAMPQMVWTCAPDGAIEDCNESWISYTGFNSSEARLLGWDGLAARALSVEDRAGYLQAWSDALASGERFEREVRLRHATGGTERWHLVIALPRRDALGSIVQWVGTCTDIHDQKIEQETLRLERGVYQRESRAAVEELVRSEERFAMLIASSPLGFYDVDFRSGESFHSPRWRQILGWGEEELPTPQLPSWDALLHPEDRDAWDAATRRDRALGVGRASFSQEFRLRHRDGSYVWIEANGLDFYDEAGQRTRSLGFHADIAGRKQAEGALRDARDVADRASRAKSEFLANMSHEIRTPMNAILGFTDLLDALISDPRARSYLSAVSTSGRALLELINDILDLSKIEADKLELHPEPVELRDLLADIQHVFSSRVVEKNLNLSLLVAPSVPQRLLLDEVRIRQVLFNLVGNAIKFTERGGVRLSAHSKAQPLPPHRLGVEPRFTLTLEVADTGVGIQADQLDRIFEAFTQASGQSTRKYGGTGLGLSITKRLVERMGGRIELQSHPGQGSIFRVVLKDVPATTAAADTVVDLSGTPSDLDQFVPATVLVAADAEVKRLLFSGYFEESGHLLRLAEDGTTALNLAATERPDLVVLDLADGVATARRLKQAPVLRDLPVIVCSAALPRSPEERALRETCDAVLRKPISKADLVREFRRFLPLLPPDAPRRSSRTRPATDPGDGAPLPMETRERWPELVQLLRVEERDVWPAFREAPNIAEVEQFAQRLDERAHSHGAPALGRYARELLREAQEFDMEALPKALGRFPHLVSDIDAACNQAPRLAAV